MPSRPLNGFSMPKPDLATGFEWQPTFDDLLQQTATSNIVDADWPILKDMIKHKLAEAISGFLAMGPPWPLAPEDALQARKRCYETLDSFSGPPFTIQRLCELSLHPRTMYTSLPKYLRAINRVLSVTSERSAFAEDEPDPLQSSTSALPDGPHDASLGVVSQGVVMSPAHHTHRRGSIPRPPPSPTPSASSSSPASSSSSSTRASPAVVPLLSPIPWLRRGGDTSSPSKSADDVEPLSLSSPPSSSTSPRLSAYTTTFPSSAVSSPTPSFSALQPAPHDPQLSPPQPFPLTAHSKTATPTGGLVDEVDPGSGTGETAEPVALSSATTLPEHEAAEGEAEGTHAEGGEAGGLRERFERAGSPMVERPLDPEVEGGANGLSGGAGGGEGGVGEDVKMDEEGS